MITAVDVKCLVLAVGAALVASACTRPINIQAISPGSSLLGLTDSDLGDSQRAAAIDVVVSAADARALGRFGGSNVNLLIQRCGAPGNYYPAFPYFRGIMFDQHAVANAGEGEHPITLTFFLPEEVQRRGAYDCATLDARGMASPVFFKSLPQRLPKGLRFETLRRSPTNGS